MSFLKGAFSRHIARVRSKTRRVAMFGSRKAYRKQKRSWGGKGHSF